MKVGFTGTFRGMTPEQMATAKNILRYMEATEFHHGDCIGADKEMSEMATRFKIPVIIHPPVDQKKRAYCKADYEFLPLPYLDRNKAIVRATEVLIAAPHQMFEHLRSGTWSTVRFARHMGRKIWTVLPDGSTTFTEAK